MHWDNNIAITAAGKELVLILDSSRVSKNGGRWSNSPSKLNSTRCVKFNAMCNEYSNPCVISQHDTQETFAQGYNLT